MLASPLFLAILASLSLPVECPPKRYFCWQVRVAASMIGEEALEAKARACRWTEKEIAAAKVCLRK